MSARRQPRDNKGQFISRTRFYTEWGIIWLISFVGCWMIGTSHQYVTKTWFKPQLLWPTPVMAYEHSAMLSPIPLETVGTSSSEMKGISWESGQATPTPTATLTPTPTPTIKIPNNYDAQQIKHIITEVFGAKAHEALKVAQCESSFRNVCNDGLNTNGSVDCGALQINLSAHNKTREEMLDARTNIEFAYSLYQRSGWGPWYSSRKCHGLK